MGWFREIVLSDGKRETINLENRQRSRRFGVSKPPVNRCATLFWAIYFPKGVQLLFRLGRAAEAPDISWGGNIHPVSSATSSQQRTLLNCRSSSPSVSLMPTSTLSLLAKLIPIEKYLKGRISGIRDGEVKKQKELFNGRL